MDQVITTPTWLAVAFVGIETLVIFELRRGCRANLGRVNRHDPASPLPRLQPFDRQPPEFLNLLGRDLVGFCEWMKSDEEQKLSPVDVAEAGDDLLVEDCGADGNRPATEAFDDQIGPVRRIEDGVRTEPGGDSLGLDGVEDLTSGRPGEVHTIILGVEDEPGVLRRFGKWGRVHLELAVEAEMYVQHVSGIEPVKDVFAFRIDRVDPASIDPFRPLGESALRRGGGHRLAVESLPLKSCFSV